ncbi:MAG: thioredoxin family protein [Muribaculaceae bacterium]|nr:thioredoxin family protein [Muribaculaceae bacterium]
MKKIFICLVAVLALVACNNKSENQNVEATEAEQVEAAVTPEVSQDGWGKQNTLKSNKPMVVDFFATWCGPCKQLAPVLEEIEKNHQGEVIFKRIDVDQEPELAMEFKIEGVPTLFFITPDGEYQSLVGYQDAPVIEAKIAELLSRSKK